MKLFSKIIQSLKNNSKLQNPQLAALAGGWVLHIVFIGMFAIFKVDALMWFNILVSVPIFTIAFILSYKGKLRLAFIMGMVEIPIHQVLAVLLIGKESGFQILLFIIIPGSILAKNWKPILVLSTLIAFILYLSIIWFDTGQFVMYELSESTLKFISSVNSLGMFTVVGAILFYYLFLAEKLHKELQQSNDKLNQTNEELNVTLELVHKQKGEIETQHTIVVKQNQHINDSIRYAQKIQQAVLPSNEMLQQALPDHFVLFKPRDVVSGDFYWMKQINNFTIIAAADSTGHGVPGAFMSMLGMGFLNEIVTQRNFDTAGEILNRLRKKIKTALRQEGKSKEQKDGMDMALCVIDSDSMQMQFAGAYNPLYLIRENDKIRSIENHQDYKTTEKNGKTLIEIKADRQPVAIHIKEKPFTTKKINLCKGDLLYTFSDGFADQNGGKKNKKYLSKNFKNLLIEIHQKSMKEQYLSLNETFENWKSNYEQIDDVLVIGIRI